MIAITRCYTSQHIDSSDPMHCPLSREAFSALLDGRISAVYLALYYDPVVIRHVDTMGNTLLHLAVTAGEDNLVAHLLLLGADIQATNFRGNTPLHLAVLQGQSTMISFLISKGADTSLIALEAIQDKVGCGTHKEN